MRYAIVFTCYQWDDFHLRQVQRIAKSAPAADVFVVVDETNGKVGEIAWDKIIRTSRDEIRSRSDLDMFMELGSWRETESSIFWWNLDYLTWVFFERHQEYDYCISMDYDACLDVDVDATVRKIADHQIDFVGHSHVPNMADWFWTPPHLATYSLEEIQARLLCVTIVSRRAANFLLGRRREMAVDYKSGRLAFWPFCEIFVATELARGGFRMAELSDFGSIARYAYRPPHYEGELQLGSESGFLHPVYDADRMLKVLCKEIYSFSDLFRGRSRFRAELSRYPLRSSARQVIKEGRKRIGKKFASALSQAASSKARLRA